jgi:hypothetical protein
MSSNYSKFGAASPLEILNVDPVEMCIGSGTMFNKQGLTNSARQVDLCPRFMSQRCAAKWDQFCDAYLTSSNYDSGGYLHINKDFLADVANKKYCRLDTSSPGAQCAVRCQPFNPEDQTSPEICEAIGTKNWRDTKNEYDLSGQFPQTAKLNPISPLYMDRCEYICDAKNPPSEDALGPNDEVINKCIQYGGQCLSILNDVVYNAVKNGTNVTNPALLQLMSYAKQDQPLNPNVATKIASAFGIPATVAFDVLQNAKYGVPNQTIDAGKEGYDPNSKKVGAIVVNPLSKKDDSENSEVEGFRSRKQIVSTKHMIGGGLVCGILIILVILIIVKLIKAY